MARPERLELPTYWFEASRSIRLSYGRVEPHRIMQGDDDRNRDKASYQRRRRGCSPLARSGRLPGYVAEDTADRSGFRLARRNHAPIGQAFEGALFGRRIHADLQGTG